MSRHHSKWSFLIRVGTRRAEQPSIPQRGQFLRNVLVVCHGNICRSPLAAALLRARLPSDTWQVVSAGTHAVLGRPASARTSAIGAEYGFELSPHRSQPLDAELIRACGHIFTMSRRQAREVVRIDGKAAPRIRLFGAFAPFENLWGLPADYKGLPADKDEVGDPIDEGLELHREGFERLRQASDAIGTWLLRGAREAEAPAPLSRWRSTDPSPLIGDKLPDL